jgi:hypothetical protein
MNKNYINTVSSKEIVNIIIRGIISVVLSVFLFLLFYCFVPVSWYSTDLDAALNINYETLNQEKVEYVFTLSGMRIKINDKIIIPRLGFSGKYNSVKIISMQDKYYVIYPVSWKKSSLYGIENKMQNTSFVNRVKSSKNITISDIKSTYQNIPIEEVIFYKTYSGINRLIYNDLNTFKIVAFSYRSEVTQPELYWNKQDGYYYLICPENAESLFQYNELYSYTDMV